MHVTIMEENSKSCSFYVLNVGAVLLLLSVVGSTLRFTVISLTLVSWLQTKWLEYTSILEKRRSARLAAAAEETRAQRRKQVADITASVGESVIALLDKRQEQVLELHRESERKRHEHEQAMVQGLTKRLVAAQESARVKGQQLKDREDSIVVLEKWIEQTEGELQALRKRLEERERDIKAAEESARKIHQTNHQPIQPKVEAFNSVVDTPPPPSAKFTLPSDLLQYANDLDSPLRFTCIGVTQKGARCRQFMISDASKSYARTRIAKMNSPDPGHTFELDALRELADWMLCPRWHLDTHPQGNTIARRWYNELGDARAKLKGRQTQTHKNSFSGFGTPSSAFSFDFSPSTGAPSVFSSNSSMGMASSVSSMQSVSMPGYQAMSPQGTGTAASAQSSRDPAARNLTPMFEAMARQSR